MKTSTRIACALVGAMIASLFAGAPLAAEESLEQQIERAKSKQDRALRSYIRRGDERGIALFAEQARQRAERESSPVNDWLAGRALHFAKQKVPAHKYLYRAYQKDQRIWQAALRLGRLYMEDRRFKDALVYINRVLRKQPTNVAALKLKVECLIPLDRWAEAERPLLFLYEKEPESVRIWEGLGRVYHKLGRPEEALKWVRRVRGTPQGAVDLSLTALQAECHAHLEQWPEARKLLTSFKGTPAWDPNPQIQKQLCMVLFKMNDPDALKKEVLDYVARVPGDVQMQQLLVALHVRDNDLDRALALLRGMREKAKEPKRRDDIDDQILVLLLRKKDEPAALVQARAMRAVATDKKRAAALDNDILMMLLRAKDFAGAQAHAEGMLKSESDGQKRDALGELIARLQRGEDPTKPRKGGPQDPNNPFIALIKRCIDEDVAVRRKALREYYDLNLPLVDPIIYQRFSPEIEPDPECRLWTVRILGRFDMQSMSEPEYAREVAKRLAVALEDPDGNVRRVAAMELGGLGVPAGLIYLLPHLYRVDLKTKPADRGAQKRIEAEYNAVRQAIVTLSGHNDLSVIDDPWIPYEKAKANLAHWDEWLDSPAATPAKLRALDDLRELKMEGMEAQRAAWFLRFSLDHCFEPSRWEVVAAAYKLLRDARRPEAEGQFGALWVGFPIVEDKDLTENMRHKLDRRLKTWWAEVAKNPEKGGRAARADAPPPDVASNEKPK